MEEEGNEGEEYITLGQKKGFEVVVLGHAEQLMDLCICYIINFTNIVKFIL